MNNDFEFDSLIKKMAAEHQPELPSPGLIWWRAQIFKKQAEKERIERPLTIMRLVAAAVSLPGHCGALDQPVGFNSRCIWPPGRDFLCASAACGGRDRPGGDGADVVDNVRG